MASPEWEAIKATFSTMRQVADAGANPTLEEKRAAAEHFGDLATEPTGVAYEYADADGVPVMLITPAEAVPGRAIEYFHGGGYQMNSIESHRKMVGHIAKAAGMTAVNVEYRLAPEHRHPAAVDDAVTVYRWLLNRGHTPTQLALAGDSAGGGLALGTLFALRQAGLPLPAAAVAISPWTDMSISGGSVITRAPTDLTPTATLLPMLRGEYVDEERWTDPTASPLSGDPTGLPPIYLQAGDDEVLRDDAVRFGAQASASGVDVTFEIVPEMQHVFVKAVGSMPEADQGVARIAAFLRRALAGGTNTS